MISIKTIPVVALSVVGICVRHILYSRLGPYIFMRKKYYNSYDNVIIRPDANTVYAACTVWKIFYDDIFILEAGSKIV